MYREIAGTDERVRATPGVRDRRVRATKVRLYLFGISFGIQYTCIQVYIRLDSIIVANKMNPDQTASIVCNMGYLRIKAGDRADNKSCDWRRKGLASEINVLFRIAFASRHYFIQQFVTSKI